MTQNPFMNPFEIWQQWLKGSQALWSNMPTTCNPMANLNPMASMFGQQNRATSEPFAFSPLMQANPMAAMEQSMRYWQNFWSPAQKQEQQAEWPAPKITIMTVELGDMKPYMGPAMELIGQWQRMWLQNMGGK